MDSHLFEYMSYERTWPHPSGGGWPINVNKVYKERGSAHVARDPENLAKKKGLAMQMSTQIFLFFLFIHVLRPYATNVGYDRQQIKYFFYTFIIVPLTN